MFGFVSVSHWVASVGKKIKAFASAAGPVLAKIDHTIEANLPVIEGLTKLVSPQAAAIEDAAYNLFGQVVDAAQKGGAAAAQNGLSLSLDKDFVAAIQALIPAIEEFARNHGVQKPT